MSEIAGKVTIRSISAAKGTAHLNFNSNVN